MKDYSNLGRIIEGIVVLLIILVLIQTLGEEYTSFMDYNVLIRKYMLIAGFCFDLIFSIEFLSRLFISAKRGGAGSYMSHEGGFVDLLSSLPLLIFHSGPLLWITFFSGEAGLFATLGALSFLKIVKVIRVARTLRFIRILKLFGKGKTRYRLTPRYISRAVSLSIMIIILTLIGFAFVNKGAVIQSKSVEVRKLLANYIESGEYLDANTLLQGTDSVLFIRKDNEVLFSSITDLEFQDTFLNDDYYVNRIGEYDVYFTNKDVKKINAYINMLAFTMILGIIIVITTLYKRFFNRHIAGVIGVMLRGFKSADYSTPVRINEKKWDFEIYQLADQYNKKWLPIKRKIVEIKREHK